MITVKHAKLGVWLLIGGLLVAAPATNYGQQRRAAKTAPATARPNRANTATATSDAPTNGVAQPSTTSDEVVRATTENLRLISEVISAAAEYRSSLDKVAEFYAADVTRALELVAKRERLVTEGIIAPREVAQSRQALQLAETRLAQVKAEILTTDNLLLETEAARLAILSPQPETDLFARSNADNNNDAGRYQVRPAIVRYNGANNWVIDEIVKIEQFYQAAFQRALPVSARGQTAVHDKLGFDHRESVDVAVHPDTPEGQRLLAYLRQQGIPFLAFSGARAGVATGAHIHIGRPSSRIRLLAK